MASTKLAEAVGYPGSSVAFAQLLSGMERDGLLMREVRGKRTYRITLPDGVAAARAAKAAQAGRGAADTGQAAADTGQASALGGADLASAAAAAGMTSLPPAATARKSGGTSGAAGGFDYDELARRLLVQVLRRLAAGGPGAPDIATVDAAGAVAEHAAREKTAALQETVAGLERELATAWNRHGSLTAENARLREQLSQAQRDLAVERTRHAPLSGELNEAEVVVLERLLDGQDNGAHQPEHPGATAS